MLALRQNQKQATQANQEIVLTDAQLHKELVDAHFALSKLSGADDQRRGQVIELLLEAGKHLGQPVTNSRLVYGPDYFINWNREGIALVAQARQLIEESAATKSAQS